MGMFGIIFMLHYTGYLIRDESFEEWLRERDVEMFNIIRRKNYLEKKEIRDLMRKFQEIEELAENTSDRRKYNV